MTNKSDFDVLQRFIFDSCDIRGELVSLHTSFIEASAHQNLLPIEKQLLGEFLAVTTLLGDSLKFNGILTLQARGNGVVPLVMADINNGMEIRGIVKHREERDFRNMSAHLSDLLGNAVLSITIDPERGERYQGIVPLEGNNIAQCLNGYFAQSEQLPSYFLSFSQGDHCGGLFLQALPAKLITDTEATKDKWDTAVHLASTLKAEELFSLSHEALLYRLFHEMQCKVFPAKPVRFKCSCDEQRSSNAIAALGKEDAFALLKEKGEIEIYCEFCGKLYLFDDTALQNLFSASH